MRIPHPRFGFRTAIVAVVALVAAPIGVTVLTTATSSALTTFLVTSPNDSGPGTLRQAFLDANTADDDTVIDFVVPGLAVSITGSPLVFNPATSADTLTINGNGGSVTRTALIDRIFEDDASGTFTINSLAISGGRVFSSLAQGGSISSEPEFVLNDSSVSGIADASGPAGGDAEGGAIWSNSPVTVTNSTVTGTADAHGTAVGAGGGFAAGGGIYANDTVDVIDSLVTGTADAHDASAAGGTAQGGALWSDDFVTIEHSTLSGQALANGNNGGTAQGGGIWSSSGDEEESVSVSLTDSMVSNSLANADGTDGAAQGGAVWVDGEATLVRSTLGNSTAQATGEGAGGEGGGLWAFDAASLTNSTVAQNAAVGSLESIGGGIFEAENDVFLVYSDVVNNSAEVGANIAGPEAGIDGVPRVEQSATLHAFASVVVIPDGGGDNCEGFAGTDTTGYNFSDDFSCDFTDPTDNQSFSNDAQLGPLAANGGLPLTLLPADASPLVDAIPVFDCQSGPASGIVTDERLLPRPEFAGHRCDIGAVEIQLNPPPPPPPTTVPEETTTTTTTLPPNKQPVTPANQVVAIQPTFTG